MATFDIPGVNRLPQAFAVQLELPGKQKILAGKRVTICSFYGRSQSESIARVLVTSALKSKRWEPIKLSDLKDEVGWLHEEDEDPPGKAFEVAFGDLLRRNHVYLLDLDEKEVWVIPTTAFEDDLIKHAELHPECIYSGQPVQKA